MRRLFGIMPFLLLFILAGCQERPSGTVFMTIDGMSITDVSVSNAVEVLAKMREIQKRPIPGNKFARWANRTATAVFPKLISARLFEAEADRMGLRPEDEDVQAVLARYNRQLRKKAKTAGELEEFFGDLAPVFRRQFDRECKFAAYSRREFRQMVSEGAVDRYMLAASNRIVQSTQINVQARRKGESALKQLHSGVPWETVAPETTEDSELSDDYKDYWKVWDSFVDNNCLLEEVKAVLPSIPVGGISGLIDTDEGLVIVKVLSREENVTTCARILIRMACLYELPSREQARERIQKDQLEEDQLQLMDELRKKAVITYPMGTNFTYKIWAEPEGLKKRKGFGK